MQCSPLLKCFLKVVLNENCMDDDSAIGMVMVLLEW